MSRWGPAALLAGAPDALLERLISRARACGRLTLATWPEPPRVLVIDADRVARSALAGGEVQAAMPGDRRPMAGPPDCANQSRPAPAIRSGARSTSLLVSATGPPAASWPTTVHCPLGASGGFQRWFHGAKRRRAPARWLIAAGERSNAAGRAWAEAFLPALSPSLAGEPPSLPQAGALSLPQRLSVRVGTPRTGIGQACCCLGDAGPS